MTLTSFTYNVIAPAGWKNRVSGKGWKELARLPWIWTPAESAHHRLLSRIFSQHQSKPHTVALVDQESSMLDLVKSGVGLSLARESIALNQAQAHGLVIADAVELSTELSFISLEKDNTKMPSRQCFNYYNKFGKPDELKYRPESGVADTNDVSAWQQTV
jgi:DNA-binding transcriptional LysR family regulator